MIGLSATKILFPKIAGIRVKFRLTSNSFFAKGIVTERAFRYTG